MWQDVHYRDVKDRSDIVWIDVRSESEFAESTIPGARNVPIFSDEERAQVGTMYKQVGVEEAKELGLKIASAKLPELVASVRREARDKQPVIFCWRGGMRSKSVATVADLLGIEVYRLEGGYRAYREDVTERLADFNMRARCVVLHGMTGVGKTQIIRSIQEDGLPILDLEGLAGHKGSAFGSIGEVPKNQRKFDSLLIEQLERYQDSPFVIMEAESKRIGRVQMPDFLVEAKEQGLHLLLEAPVEVRVQRTLDQYIVGDPDFQDKVRRAIDAIQKAFTPQQKEWLWQAVDEKRYSELVRYLLVEYYDPRYKHAGKQYVDSFIRIDATNIEDCQDAIVRTIEEHIGVEAR